MEYILIGKVVNTFGIKGELKVDPYTDFVEDRFKKGSKIYLGEEHLPFVVKSCREHKGMLLLLLEAHVDINLVEKYKDFEIYKADEDIEPVKDGYYFRDLKDLDVYVGNERVGRVLRVEEGIKANHLRILKNDDKKEYLVPFLPVFVEKVDLENKRIDIVKMEGLL